MSSTTRASSTGSWHLPGIVLEGGLVISLHVLFSTMFCTWWSEGRMTDSTSALERCLRARGVAGSGSMGELCLLPRLRLMRPELFTWWLGEPTIESTTGRCLAGSGALHGTDWEEALR